ncbi:hypothetical protein F4827_002233 [Paraburkholderia bannensis]|uniref:Uncharacterized protein n=1 Tax=Paraburkholderia bannensis TaxID=765414 RepID=A0A7W9TWG0_9BURK|nr:hypothetical protein [Paraburkholderia bannensis]MBB3257220.1 hypothetical protein [Paraburkholderia sp. WP4_3_2]MBB6102384.1 hypothetical protein [Paraburkholderia bannensis]
MTTLNEYLTQKRAAWHAQRPGFENIPIFPNNIRYTLDIVSSESAETIRLLHEAVKAKIYSENFLVTP